MDTKEINEKIAPYLGWEYIPPTGGSDGYWYRHHTKSPYKENQFPFLDDYAGSIEAAWEIAEKIKAETLFDLSWHDGFWHCHIDFGERPYEIDEEADTAPMAICLAFLKLIDSRSEAVIRRVDEEGERD